MLAFMSKLTWIPLVQSFVRLVNGLFFLDFIGTSNGLMNDDTLITLNIKVSSTMIQTLTYSSSAFCISRCIPPAY